MHHSSQSSQNTNGGGQTLTTFTCNQHASTVDQSSGTSLSGARHTDHLCESPNVVIKNSFTHTGASPNCPVLASEFLFCGWTARGGTTGERGGEVIGGTEGYRYVEEMQASYNSTVGSAFLYL
jgi:hypothetical protein